MCKDQVRGQRSEKRQELGKGLGLSEGVGGLSSGLMLGRVILGWLGGSGSRSLPTNLTQPLSPAGCSV